MSSQNIPTPELKTTFEILMIKQKITEINESIKKMECEGKTDSFDFELEIMTQFPDFYQAHPFLVKKLCKRDDITVLYKMLDSLQQVENGDQSLASVELNLGTELADKFIYPNLKK